MIVASVASLSSRRDLLRKTFQSLRNQVDAVVVYLNGYDQVPAFLHHPKVLYAVLSKEAGWRGDEAKFWFFDPKEFAAAPRWKPDDVILTCDDDIVYPADYADSMVAALTRHLDSVVTIHGSIIVQPFVDYATSRVVARTRSPLGEDTQVHIPGTGTSAFRLGTLPFSIRDDITWSHAVDLHVAAVCRRLKVPIWAIARPGNWAMPLHIPRKGTSIQRQRTGDAVSFETTFVRSIGDWEELNTSAIGLEDRRIPRVPSKTGHRPAKTTCPPASRPFPGPVLKRASELMSSWTEYPLKVRPFPGFFGFNPSIHCAKDGVWRCIVRQANYHMPGGVPVLPRDGRIVTRNAIATLDPADWSVTRVTEMRELDDEPRLYDKCVGYEDLRLVQTQRDGFVAIATTMQLNAGVRQEMVVLGLDNNFQIISAEPLRGAWSTENQKNWTPFDGASELMLLFSVERGGIYNRVGEVIDPSHVVPPPKPKVRRRHHRKLRPPYVPAPVPVPDICLRGGSQLVEVAPDQWLGIAHRSLIVGSFKFYSHVNYVVNGRGVIKARSEPYKLSEYGIEFCAGLAIDRQHGLAVISYGTEDQDAHLATTPLQSILATLKPVSQVTP